MSFKVGDLVIVNCLTTGFSQSVIIRGFGEKNNGQDTIVYSVYPGRNSWARFNQLETIPGQNEIISEVKEFLNGQVLVKIENAQV